MHPDPREELHIQITRVRLAHDPTQALRAAATRLAPLRLCGQLTEGQMSDALEEAADSRGIDGDDTATILFLGTTALFN